MFGVNYKESYTDDESHNPGSISISLGIVVALLYLILVGEILQYWVLKDGWRLLVEVLKYNRVTIVTACILFSVYYSVPLEWVLGLLSGVLLLRYLWLCSKAYRERCGHTIGSRGGEIKALAGRSPHSQRRHGKHNRKPKYRPDHTGEALVIAIQLNEQQEKEVAQQRLCKACCHGDVQTVRAILAQYSGSLLRQSDKVINTAVKAGSVQVFLTILQYVDLTTNLLQYADLLHIAVQHRHHRILTSMLHFIPGLVGYINKPINNTLLVIAAVKVNSLRCVRVLRSHGVDMMLMDRHGHCALLYAIEKKQRDIVKYILNTSSQNHVKHYRNILHSEFSRALENFHWDTVKLLLTQRKCFLAMDDLLSVVYKHNKLVHLDCVVIGNGCSVNRYNEDGEVPFEVYLVERWVFLTNPLPAIIEKLVLHIKAGLDCNRFRVHDKNDLTCVGLLLDSHSDICYTHLLKRLIYILHESGYTFTQDLHMIRKDVELLHMYLKLTSEPHTLKRLCSNVVRCTLQPNAITGIKQLKFRQLKLPAVLQKYILMDECFG